MEQSEAQAQLEQHHAASYGWALSCCSHNREEAEDVLELTQYAKLSNWQAATDSLLTSTASPLGRTLTTPTDAWLGIPLTVPD